MSGLFDRVTGEWLNNGREVVEAMKRGIFTEDKSYTLQWVYENRAPVGMKDEQ